MTSGEPSAAARPFPCYVSGRAAEDVFTNVVYRTLRKLLPTQPDLKSGVAAGMLSIRETVAYDAIVAAACAFAAARVAEERVYELGGACIIASQVAELAKEMTSPFKEGVETACEEIIHRLMEAGAPRLVDTDESRTVRARLTDPTLRAPEGAQP